MDIKEILKKYFRYDLKTQYCGCDNSLLAIVDDDANDDYLDDIGDELAYNNYIEMGCEDEDNDSEIDVEGGEYYFEREELTPEEFKEISEDYLVEDLTSK